MKRIIINSAWHITQVCYYLHNIVKEEKIPVCTHFNDTTIIMIPDEYDSDIDYEPEWEERSLPKDEVISL